MSKQEVMSQISKIGNYQPQVANDLLKLAYNNDKDGSIYQSLKEQFHFGDNETIGSIVKKIANGIEGSYKERGMGRVFNDTFQNPSTTKNSDDAGSFRLSSLKDDGNMDARPSGYGDRFTIASRPLTDVSPLAGPYFCPETPDRVMVDGIIVVNRPDEVRDFFNGKVMVMHIRGGNPSDFNKPGTSRCGIVDKYRKAIQEYESLYKKVASRGSNLIPWTFYLDNAGYSEEEQVPDIKELQVAAGTAMSVSFSRFDGRDNFGYVKFLEFTDINDLKVEKAVNFFKRAKGPDYEIYADKILGDSDTIRFVEGNGRANDGMTVAARERVQKFLKSDQTVVITIKKSFLESRGFDEKMANLFNIVKRLRQSNSSFYDRIAYYFYQDDIQPEYEFTEAELNWAYDAATRKGKTLLQLDANQYKQKIQGMDDKDQLNQLYNCTDIGIEYNAVRKSFITTSSTSLFQILRGSKSTSVMEMYIAKDAPDYYTAYSYAEKNEFTENLCLENIVNLMCIPYVTETLLAQFAQRSELFPILTSESRARRFYVRPLYKNPFAVVNNTNGCFIFKHNQLQPGMIEDLKNGFPIILHPECDGTEGSCIPPQLEAIASRYGAILHQAHRSLFDFEHGAKVVMMRAERRFATNNFELFIKSATKWTTFDPAGNCVPATSLATSLGRPYDASSCKFSSEDLDIKAIMDFLSKHKLSNKQYKSSSGTVVTGAAGGVQGLVQLWDSY